MIDAVPAKFYPTTEPEQIRIVCPCNDPRGDNMLVMDIPDTGVTVEVFDSQKQFSELADKWESETGFYSSPTKRFSHPAYKTIMDMGTIAVPMILNRMKRKPDDWFWALKHLAGDYDAAAGIDNFDGAVNAWLEWGRQRGYVE
jgi:hypothetical protein